MSKVKFNGIGQDIFESRYAGIGETSWSDRAEVVAKTISMAEKEEDRESVREKFYQVLNSLDLLPGGRINYGSGRNTGKGGHNLLNCFNLTPYDNVESIGRTIQDTYKITCAGGGVGFNFSRIRPKGDDIQNIKNSAPGSVSVMKMINEIIHHVKAGKNRRGALMAMLNDNHPDLLEFLHVKLDKKELTNFNISVAITNRFIQAVENDEEWYFFFNNKRYFVYLVSYNGVTDTKVVALNEEDAINRANKHYKLSSDTVYTSATKVTYKARDLWNLIYTNSLKCGDPGIFNIDLANEHTNVAYFSKIVTTNPCGEIPLEEKPEGGGNCCLGHINLANMVDNGEFNWKRFARAVRTGVRFLDDVLEVNQFPTEECRRVALESRRIGLGVTGYAYMLIKLNLRYGSEKALEFTERLFATYRDEAYKQSAYLARDKGPFQNFDAKKFLDQGFAKTLPARIRMLIKEHGIRNAVMLTIAPTGTISLMAGISSGIEPIFSPLMMRTYRVDNTLKESFISDPLFEEYIKNGSMPNKDIFVGAYDVTPEEHMKVQATVQKYIDQSVSKTINLPSTYQGEELASLALKYAPYLKGMTIYRAGSKGNEPIKCVPITEENIAKITESLVTTGEACSINGGNCG